MKGTRKRIGVLWIGSLLALLMVAMSLPARGVQAVAFDFDSGNAAAEVVIPTGVPYLFQSVSPTAGDATLVLRMTTLLTNAWFDAIAPYHPTAVGVYSSLGRRPASEATQRNKNIAIMYASYRVLNSLLPQHAPAWREMMLSVGLDPDDSQTDTATHRHRQHGGQRRRPGTGARRHESAGRRGRPEVQPPALRRLHRLQARQHALRAD